MIDLSFIFRLTFNALRLPAVLRSQLKFYLISAALFIASFIAILLFLPASIIPGTKNHISPERAEGWSPYAVPVNIAFNKIEAGLKKDSGNENDVIFFSPYEIIVTKENVSTSSLGSNDVTQFTSVAKLKSNDQLVYSANYIIENELRRVGKKTHYKGSKVALVFVGCSFTFGQGVEFEETVPGLFEEYYPELDVYSFALPGMALNDHLFKLKNGSHPLNKRKNERIILVYTFVADHIFRESCSTACLSEKFKYPLEKPRFEMQGDTLNYVGNHSVRYFNNFVTRLIFNSDILYAQHFPELNSDTNFRRHQFILNEFYAELQKHQRLLAAYDFIGMGSELDSLNKLLPYVLKTQYKPIFLDYHNQPLKNGLRPYLIPYDRHPSPLGYAASFEALRSVLKKDFPEVF